MELTLNDIYWAEEQLKRFTYKPGWTLTMVDPTGPFGDPFVRIVFYTEDTYRPGRQIPVTSQQPLPAPWIIRRDEDKFARYLQDALFKVERHESQEWLRRDGVIFDNPHK